jgi:hypothetical protein
MILPAPKAYVERKRPHCALCGSTVQVERHHVGGRFHVAWFTVALCRTHHVRLTEMLRVAGVDMTYTADVRKRLVRILRAMLVFGWMVLEWLSCTEKDNVRKP